MKQKVMTRSEAETKRRKAIEFLRRIGQDEDAERFEVMTPEEYAEHKGAELLQNPSQRRTAMARVTKDELSDTLDEISDLAEEALDPELTREEVVAKVKELADLASGEEAEDVDSEEEEDLDSGE